MADQPEIQALDGVSEFVQEDGGSLYIWLDRAGLERVTTARPAQEVSLVEITADGFHVYQDRAFEAPTV